MRVSNFKWSARASRLSTYKHAPARDIKTSILLRPELCQTFVLSGPLPYFQCENGPQRQITTNAHTKAVRARSAACAAAALSTYNLALTWLGDRKYLLSLHNPVARAAREAEGLYWFSNVNMNPQYASNNGLTTSNKGCLTFT